ncbi:MAG: TorF family putative porin [Bacteroidota bacterium]
MKSKILTLISVVFALTVSLNTAKAQEEEESSVWSTGMDIYSSYIWRGSKFGSGPAFQPYVDATVGGFSVGAWGSVNASSNESLEMDLYLGYSFDFGLGIALTDYYFGGDWTEVSSTHYLEPMVTYEGGGFSATFAYMFLPETETTDFAEEGDLYLEAGYSFGAVDVALGLGDGQYTVTDDNPDGDFNVCNITIGTSKEIKLSDSFILPVSGAVTLNPTTGGFFITAGISL